MHEQENNSFHRIVDTSSIHTISALPGLARNGRRTLRLSIASTFTSNPLEDVLTFWSEKSGYRASLHFSPYDQIFQELMDQNSSLNHPDHHARVVILKVDDWIRNLTNTVDFFDHRHIVANIESLGKYAIRAAAYVKSPLFIIITRNSKGSPISEKKQNEYEKLIKNTLSNHSNICVITSREIDQKFEVVDYYDDQRDQLGHIPYKKAYFSAIGTSLFRGVLASQRNPFKVIVLDCDNTLWGGVCGEVHPDKLNMSAPYSDLHSFMLRQIRSGKILCLCSKNVQEDVDRVFHERPDMVLGKENFVSSRINWQPKSQNIKELADELNLGLDSFIFVDDNPVECAEVRTNCPQVLTINLPENPEEIGVFLDHIWAFDTLKLTHEDKHRTRFYKDHIKRTGFQDSSASMNEFIEGLNLDIRIRDVTSDEIGRVSQLTYRTNQFNFTTIRRSVEEIQELLDRDGLVCKVCRVKDRFGDYGLVGAMIYERLPDRILLDSFMLSCRVLGRGVEYSMLRAVGEAANAHGVNSVWVQFSETEKNRPAFNFLQSVSEGISGNTPLTDSGYWMPSDELTGLTYKPGDLKPGETGVNGHAKKKRSIALREHQWQMYEQIATELYQPSKIAEFIDTQKKSTVWQPPESSASKDKGTLQLISKIWQKILNRDDIGPDEHFFAVGGTSFKAVEVLSELNVEFNRNLTIVTLFEHSTIRLLADLVENNEKNSSDLERIRKKAGSGRNRYRRK